MNESYKVLVAVTTLVIDKNRVLLVRRKNTGFMDGYYAIPGGHLEPGETLAQGAARELKEETGLTVKLEDLELFHIIQDESESPKDYLSFRFVARRWSGTPIIGEPKKSNDVGFFDLEDLPKISP